MKPERIFTAFAIIWALIMSIVLYKDATRPRPQINCLEVVVDQIKSTAEINRQLRAAMADVDANDYLSDACRNNPKACK